MITEEAFKALEVKVEVLTDKVSNLSDELLGTRKEYVDINDHILKELKKLNRKLDLIPCGNLEHRSVNRKKLE